MWPFKKKKKNNNNNKKDNVRRTCASLKRKRKVRPRRQVLKGGNDLQSVFGNVILTLGSTFLLFALR
jgi:hypothetical protein